MHTIHTIKEALHSIPSDGAQISHHLIDFKIKNKTIILLLSDDIAIQKLCSKHQSTITKLLDAQQISFCFMNSHSDSPSQQSMAQNPELNSATPSFNTHSRSESRRTITNKRLIPGVKKSIAIISGKGGVGKSSIATYLAIALSHVLKHVGLLDADIYGPSLSRMLNAVEQPVMKNDIFIPPVIHKLKFISVGLLIEANDALLWRGPMASKMLHQLLHATDWKHHGLFSSSDTECLVIDTPPGTGDVLLSLLQGNTIDGAIVVSTPQKVALDAANKSVMMLRKMNVPILGIVENMGSYSATTFSSNADSNGVDTEFTKASKTSQNEIISPFGKGHVEDYAQSENIKYLASIPLMADISSALDNGNPWQSFKDRKSILAGLFMQLAYDIRLMLQDM